RVASLFPSSPRNQLRSRGPKRRKKLLVDRAHQIARSQRSARSASGRPNHALHELYVIEPPLSEQLLVLEQRLGKKEEERRTRPEIQVLELRTILVEQREEEILQRRACERALHELWNVAVLLERLHEVRITKARGRFDRAELHALRATRGAEVGAE